MPFSILSDEQLVATGLGVGQLVWGFALKFSSLNLIPSKQLEILPTCLHLSDKELRVPFKLYSVDLSTNNSI